MRIAACVYLAPRKLGSMEQWLLELCAEATRRGHTVHLFIHLPVHPVIAAQLNDLRVGWTALAELESHPLRWGRRLAREYDVVYLNLAAPRGRGALAANFAWPRPVLFFEGTSGPPPGTTSGSRLGRLLDPWTFVRVRALAGCSWYVVERDRQRFRFPKDRCAVVYNGIDPNRFAPASDSHAVPGLVAVANLIREKGLHVLIEACRSLTDLRWRLAIVGDGPEAGSLERLAAEAGLADRISFPGLRDDVEVFLRDSDIYVHPAIWDEAFGLTITEAMAAGCAVVATAVGGIPEIIEHEQSGLLVPRGDPVALADCLRKLLGDPLLRSRLAEAGRARVVARFTLLGSAHGQLDWIERSVLGASGRSSVA